MARTRNIKPGFFQNEEIATLPPMVRLVFIGSWTIADYKGCFEWRPSRLKVQLAPYDRVDLDKIFEQLRAAGFVRRYTIGGQGYVKIVNFEKHQNPHKQERESGSEIPDIGAPGARETRSKVRSARKICTQSAEKRVESDIQAKSSDIQKSQTTEKQEVAKADFRSNSEVNVPLTSTLNPQTVTEREAAKKPPPPPPPETTLEPDRFNHPAVVIFEETFGFKTGSGFATSVARKVTDIKTWTALLDNKRAFADKPLAERKRVCNWILDEYDKRIEEKANAANRKTNNGQKQSSGQIIANRPYRRNFG